MFDINKLLHGWLVCTIFIMHLLWKIAKLTRSLRSLVRSAIFYNSCIKISNLYLCNLYSSSNLYLYHATALYT